MNTAEKKDNGVLWIGNFFSKPGVSPSPSQYLASRLKEKNGSVFTTSRYKNRILKFLDMVFTIIWLKDSYEMALIDVYSGRAFLWAEKVAQLLKILHKPYVLSLHGGALPEFALKNSNRILKTFGNAIKIVAPSLYLQEKLSAYSKNIYCIPNSISLDKYPFILRNRPKANIVWLRSFHQIYNPVMAIETLFLLRQEFPEIHLTMIGSDKKDGSLEEVRKRIAKYKLHNQVTIIPGIANAKVSYYLNQADLFINTTNIDNTPVSVLEAMACGLCVISTNVGGVPYLLKDNENALLVTPNDAYAMAAAVRNLLTDSELAMKISQGGRKKAENFDAEKILSQWVSLLTSLKPENAN